jgi:hypothetical protein
MVGGLRGRTGRTMGTHIPFLAKNIVVSIFFFEDPVDAGFFELTKRPFRDILLVVENVVLVRAVVVGVGTLVKKREEMEVV